MRLPEEYKARMKDLLGQEYDDYIRSLDEEPANALRVNTAAVSTEEFERISPFPLSRVPWCAEGYYYPKDVKPGRHPYWYAGLYYMQEASAMIPAAIFPVNEGDIILDACCAPGGKSTALACRMNGTGLLVSNDISASRQNATLKNMERFGVHNAYITAADLKRMSSRFPEYFDSILLDAPCSGEGMFRRDPSLIHDWEEHGPAYYAKIQRELAEEAVKMLKPGGMLVYSTCTFSPEENEETVLHLCRSKEMQVVPVKERCAEAAPGVLNGTQDCLRMYPHKLKGEGHFAALLQKEGVSTPAPRTEIKSDPLPRCCEDFLSMVDPHLLFGRFRVISDSIYIVPDIPFPEKNLRILRSGLLLGSAVKDRFEPSQALAFACRNGGFAHTVCFSADDPRVLKYLRGETVTADTAYTGWVLVCVEKWPLGFGKQQGHTVKNRIQKGFRML